MDIFAPTATEAEWHVIGSVMDTNGRSLDDIALRGDDFADKRMGDFFDLMRERYASGQPVDVLSMNELDHTMDPTALLAIEYRRGTSIEYIAEIVSKHGLARRLQAVGDGLRAFGAEKFESSQVMTERAQRMMDEALGQSATRVRFLADILPDVFTTMRTAATFIKTPWWKLNTFIGGLRPGAVYVIGARPGVGKSVIALQLAQALAEQGSVAFSSLEMSDEELVKRILSERLGIPMDRTSNNAMTADDWLVVNERRSLIETRIAIDARATVGPLEIKQFARQVGKVQPLAGIVVDYLQLMSSTDSKQSRYQAVSEFSRQMKLLAKDLRVPVILLSQLNRNSTTALNAAPKMSELRDSGAIEQDADVVILLHRDLSDDSVSAGTITLDVAKNRHGSTGVFDLAWEGHYARAMDMWGNG